MRKPCGTYLACPVGVDFVVGGPVGVDEGQVRIGCGSVANSIWRQVLRRYSLDSELLAARTIFLPLLPMDLLVGSYPY
jgi:hypothetical protein